MLGRVGVGGFVSLAREGRRLGRDGGRVGERGRRGSGPERQSLDSSSRAGQFAASGGALWRISNLGAGLQLP